MIIEKSADDSRTEQVHVVTPADLNSTGRLFGGMLLKWIDEVAGITALRHAASPSVTTAAIDNLQFKSGAYSGDLLVIIGHITYVGRTSMEVRVDTYVEDTSGMRHPINRAYFVMVGMDENNHPVPVPGLIIETESQRAEWNGGIKRKELRLKRRADGF